MSHIVLYHTEGCHLCEQAEALLRACGTRYRCVDIALEPALLDRYGVRIPVLKQADSDVELGWPFDELQLRTWLAK